MKYSPELTTPSLKAFRSQEHAHQGDQSAKATDTPAEETEETVALFAFDVDEFETIGRVVGAKSDDGALYRLSEASPEDSEAGWRSSSRIARL